MSSILAPATNLGILMVKIVFAWIFAIIAGLAVFVFGLWATFASFQTLTAVNATFGWQEALAAFWFTLLLAGAGSLDKI